MKSKRVSSAAVQALKEALTHVYWYKSDLRSFLSNCLSQPALLSKLNWAEYKRNVVSRLVDFLARNQNVYQADLLRLITDVAEIHDFSHLARLDDGPSKAAKAEEAVDALRELAQGFLAVQEDEAKAEERRQAAHEHLMRVTGVQERLQKLNAEYLELVTSEDAQARGYALEKLLRDVFELFDLDPKASFKLTGEQIDGAFSFEGTDYLLEAKWCQDLMTAKDLDSLAGPLSRRLDNTLGLYLSINGFSSDAVKTHSSGRRLLILMDGSDLMAVLEGRIDLIQLLLRKRRAAAQTGNIYLRIHEIL